MPKSDSPYLADWFAISLRWLCLLGLGISQALVEIPSTLAGATLLAAAIWNLIMTLLAVFNRRLALHRPINTILDCLFSLTMFFATGGLTGPVAWVSMLSICSAAIYYGVWGSLGVALTLLLVQNLYTYFFTPSLFTVFPLGVLSGFNLILALVLGLLSIQLYKRLRLRYQELQQQKQEGLRSARRQEHDRMQTLFRLMGTLSGTLNYQTVLETSLNLASHAIEEDSASNSQLISAILLFDDTHLKVTASHLLSVRDQRLEFPAEQGLLSEVLKSGAPRLIHDPHTDPELNRLLAMETCKSAVCLPLIRGLDAYGVMLFAHPQKNFFTPERIDVLEMISYQAVIAIQNARLFQQVAEEKERIASTQEEAQKKLARDLHDGPTQSLASIAMRLNIARKLLTQNPAEAEIEIQHVEDLARRTTQEIRHMLFTLRPLVLETEGLSAALTTMAEKMRDTFQQNVNIEVDPKVIAALDTIRQTVVFYLAEEAVTNARKHAQATQIRVLLRYSTSDRQIAVLEIQDNGVGFDVNTVMGSYEHRGSLGMLNLQERSELINGLLRVHSQPGKGTRIQVFIPLDEAAADRLHRGK
ncbi:MAG TPA: GAF domain-containing sensor histidine kinase [Anaerolineaceae bacterium]